MSNTRPNNEEVRVGVKAKAYLKKRAWKQRKTIKQVIDDLCFPKKLKVKTLKGV